MNEYLSEKEQIELIKNWWKENRWFLIGGALIAALGYFGFDQYRAYQNRVAEEAAALYQQLAARIEDDDRAGADEILGQLAADYSGSAYLDLARFMIAKEYLIRDTDRSISELSAVIAESADEDIVRIARLRLSRALAYDRQFERALDALDIDDAGEFGARYSEIRGDIYAAMGDDDAARMAYNNVLLTAGTGNVDLEFVLLKLNALAERVAPADPVPPASPDESPETGSEPGATE